MRTEPMCARVLVHEACVKTSKPRPRRSTTGHEPRVDCAREKNRRTAMAEPSRRYFGAQLSEGTLLPGDDARIAETRFEDWLSRLAAAN
jgi:hypothetical protein